MGKIAAAAVTAALFGTVVRRGAPELALLLTVTAGVWILTAVLDGLGANWRKWMPLWLALC